MTAAKPRLSHWQGKYVLVNFWAPTCVRAVPARNAPRLNALQKREFGGV